MMKEIIGVVGAGSMGSGIAQVAASHGHEVKLFESNAEAATKSAQNLDKVLFRLIEKKKITEQDKNSIQGTIIANGDVSKLLTELDSNVLMIKENIAKDKKALLEITTQRPSPDDFEQKVSEITNRILTLKNELNQAKEEFKIIKYMVYE